VIAETPVLELTEVVGKESKLLTSFTSKSEWFDSTCLTFTNVWSGRPNPSRYRNKYARAVTRSALTRGTSDLSSFCISPFASWSIASVSMLVSCFWLSCVLHMVRFVVQKVVFSSLAARNSPWKVVSISFHSFGRNWCDCTYLLKYETCWCDFGVNYKEDYFVPIARGQIHLEVGYHRCCHLHLQEGMTKSWAWVFLLVKTDQRRKSNLHISSFPPSRSLD
jgi:hypothetical protein